MTRDELAHLIAQTMDTVEAEHDADVGFPPEQIAERRNSEQYLELAARIVGALEAAGALRIEVGVVIPKQRYDDMVELEHFLYPPGNDGSTGGPE